MSGSLPGSDGLCEESRCGESAPTTPVNLAGVAARGRPWVAAVADEATAATQGASGFLPRRIGSSSRGVYQAMR